MLSPQLLHSVSVFTNIQAESISIIAQASQLNYYKKGTVVYDAVDNKAAHFYYIVRGWIKLVAVTLEGTEFIQDILTDTYHFNESLLLEDKVEPLAAQALTDVQLLTTPMTLLKQLLSQDSQFAINLLKTSLRKQRELTHEIEHLATQNASQRIGCFLLRLCSPQETKAITLHLPYDKSLLAARLGMCPETFSRALTKLIKQCHIKIDGENIYIPNIEPLIQLVCRQCSLIYPCQSRSKSSLI